MTKNIIKQVLRLVWSLRKMLAISFWIGLLLLLGFTALKMGKLLLEGHTIPISLLGIATVLIVPFFFLALWLEKEGQSGKESYIMRRLIQHTMHKAWPFYALPASVAMAAWILVALLGLGNVIIPLWAQALSAGQWPTMREIALSLASLLMLAGGCWFFYAGLWRPNFWARK